MMTMINVIIGVVPTSANFMHLHSILVHTIIC